MTTTSPKDPVALKEGLLERVGKTVHYHLDSIGWRSYEIKDEGSATFLWNNAVSEEGFNHDYCDAPMEKVG